MMIFLFPEWGSTKTGEQEQLIVTALHCVLRVPRYIPQEQRFDVRVLVRFSLTTQNITTTIAEINILSICLLRICVSVFVCVSDLCILLCTPGSGSTN